MKAPNTTTAPATESHVMQMRDARQILNAWGSDALLPAKGEKLHVNLPPNKSGFNLATFELLPHDKIKLVLAHK